MSTKENKGITLIALTIAVILLLIISGISITAIIQGEEDIQESEQIYELSVVQHAILERYTKVQLTNGTLPGNTISKAEVQLVIDEMNSESGKKIQLKGIDSEYKVLNKEHLEELGITEEENVFIVNYHTGEVINRTLKVTDLGKPLYIYARSED